MSKRALPTLLLIAAFLCASCSAAFAQADPEQTLARALQAHQAGKLEEAARDYEAFLALRPERIEARSNLGAVYARLGRYADAVTQYRRALKLDAANAAIRFNLAVAYYKSDQIREAAAELEQVIKAQADNKNATLLLADCYSQMGQDQKVIEMLTPQAAKHTEDLALAYLLGTALLHAGKIAEGQIYIDKILRRGDSAEARMMMGTGLMMAADYAGAARELATAVKLNPKLPTVHALYGRVLMMTGDTDQAKEEFQRELELNPRDFEANLQLGVLLKKDQELDAAAKYFERALQMRPGEPNSRFYIASIQVAQGQFPAALPALEQLVKDAPDFVEAHVMLATVYYRLKRRADGDREQAIVNKLNAERQAKQPGAKTEK